MKRLSTKAILPWFFSSRACARYLNRVARRGAQFRATLRLGSATQAAQSELCKRFPRLSPVSYSRASFLWSLPISTSNNPVESTAPYDIFFVLKCMAIDPSRVTPITAPRTGRDFE